MAGRFLANPFDADPDAAKTALAGVPPLKEERASCKASGNCSHAYYYDKPIADDHTLKIIREDIETSYKERLSDVYDKMEALVQKKGIRRIGHHRASGLRERVLTSYIMTDLKEFRRIQGNDTLGGMAIHEASG